MKENTDKVVKYVPQFCKQCGETLTTQEPTLVSRKQEIDLPPIFPQYIEHQSYSCTCKKCSSITISELPERLQANIQYGAQVSAWVAYFSVRQYISYNRIVEMMRDCFHLPISQGTIDNILKSMTHKAESIYAHIQERVERSLSGCSL